MKIFNKFNLLLLCSFFIGMSGLIAEYLIATMNSYLLGNSLEQFAVTIGLMFITMGLGAWISKKIQTNIVITFIIIECILASLIAGSSFITYASFAYIENHFSLIQYALIGSIGALIGMEIPLITRIVEEQNIALDVNISRVFTLDYLGGGVGAWLWVHYLLGKTNLYYAAIWFGVINIVIAFIIALVFLKKKSSIQTTIAFVCSSIVLFMCYINGQSWITNAEQRLYDDPIVIAETTPYQRIVMTHNRELNEYRLYLNGSTQFSSVDEKIYHENLVHPAFALVKNPQNALILGGGDGCALREVKKYNALKKIVLVDLDKGMTDLASKNSILRQINQNAFDDKRVFVTSPAMIPEGDKVAIRIEDDSKDKHRGQKEKTVKIAETFVYNKDAFSYVMQEARKKDILYDVIIIDFPDPESESIAKLYSKEFFHQVAKLLTPEGVIAIQATSPYHATKTYACIGKSLQAGGLEVMPYHENVPSFGDWGWFIAKPIQSKSNSLAEKVFKIDTLAVETSHLTAFQLHSNFAFGKEMMNNINDPKIIANTLMQPTILEYYEKQSWKIN